MNAKIILSAAAITCSIGTYAQNTGGTIQYETTILMGDMGGENIPKEIAAMIPKESKSKNVLYFSPASSLYQGLQTQEQQGTDVTSSSENVNIKISINTASPEEKTYIDIANKRIVEQKEIMGKRFLVVDQLEKMKWKITGRQKVLSGYPVQEATAINDKDTILAWYCPEIPVATGPMGIAGLPGLVLEASIGSHLTVLATNLKLNEDVSAKIKEPTKGKQVTSEQFKKIAKEKEAEMKQQFSGNGNVIIKTISN